MKRKVDVSKNSALLTLRFHFIKIQEILQRPIQDIKYYKCVYNTLQRVIHVYVLAN